MWADSERALGELSSADSFPLQSQTTSSIVVSQDFRRSPTVGSSHGSPPSKLSGAQVRFTSVAVRLSLHANSVSCRPTNTIGFCFKLVGGKAERPAITVLLCIDHDRALSDFPKWRVRWALVRPATCS